MAIVVKLDDLLHDRRMTLTELADRVGMSLANLSILKTGKARAIRFSTLEAICEALTCQPGAPLSYAPAIVCDSCSRKQSRARANDGELSPVALAWVSHLHLKNALTGVRSSKAFRNASADRMPRSRRSRST